LKLIDVFSFFYNRVEILLLVNSFLLLSDEPAKIIANYRENPHNQTVDRDQQGATLTAFK
jgi:hypothetical protein